MSRFLNCPPFVWQSADSSIPYLSRQSNPFDIDEIVFDEIVVEVRMHLWAYHGFLAIHRSILDVLVEC